MYPCEICGIPRDGKSRYDNSGSPHDCITAQKDEIERLRAELAAAARANDRLSQELSDATKAGTPYWHERDMMNGLVLANQKAKGEIERLRGILRRMIKYARPFCVGEPNAAQYHGWLSVLREAAEAAKEAKKEESDGGQ